MGLMSWQIYLIINLVTATVRETLQKKIVSKIDPTVSLFYISLISYLLFYLFFFFQNRTIPRFDILVALNGILVVITFIAYFYAIQISLSQSILFQSYSILVAVLLAALFLGESQYFDLTTAVGWKVAGGIVLAFLALWYLLHTGRKSEEKLEKKWFVYIIIVIIVGGIGSFVSAFSLKTFSSLEVLINQTNVILPLYFLLIVVQKKKLQLALNNFKLIGTLALVSTIAVIAFLEGLKLSSVSKFYPLQQTTLVITTMLSGVIFFKEGGLFHGKKLIGMVLGLVGMVLLITS